MSPPDISRPRLATLLAGDGRTVAERERLVELITRLAELPPPPDPCGLYPRYPELHDRLAATLAGTDGEAAEEAFLALYAHLHGHVAPYTASERAAVDRAGGYWCHAGGLAPVLKAPDWIRRDTVSADLGAGNGLQLLLVQLLAPHRRAVQVEISAAMIEAGRALQRWLGLPEACVEWRHADVTSVSAAELDFLYLYRPVKPDGPGGTFYRRLADEIGRAPRPSVIFSVADCLAEYLPASFVRFYFDGHLACFRRDPVAKPASARRARAHREASESAAGRGSERSIGRELDAASRKP